MHSIFSQGPAVLALSYVLCDSRAGRGSSLHHRYEHSHLDEHEHDTLALDLDLSSMSFPTCLFSLALVATGQNGYGQFSIDEELAVENYYGTRPFRGETKSKLCFQHEVNTSRRVSQPSRYSLMDSLSSQNSRPFGAVGGPPNDPCVRANSNSSCSLDVNSRGPPPGFELEIRLLL